MRQPCSATLIFRKGNPTPAFELPVDSDNRTEESHNLHGRLSERKRLHFNRKVCSYPGPLGPEGRCREPLASPRTPASH